MSSFLTFIRAIFQLAWGVIVLSFFMTLIMALIGFLRPWPDAEAAFQDAGIRGFPITISGSSYYERFGEEWHEGRKRTYIVISNSLEQWELVHYSVSRSSEEPESSKLERKPLY